MPPPSSKSSSQSKSKSSPPFLFSPWLSPCTPWSPCFNLLPYDEPMRPHPRIRKTVKWGGASLAVLVLIMWIGSDWYFAQYNWGSLTLQGIRSGVPNSGGGVAHLGAGEFYFVRVWPPIRMGGTPGWRMEANQRPFQFLPSISMPSNTIEVRVPLWLLVLLLGGCTVWAWRLDMLASRRQRVDACPKCNYSRTGLAPSAVCPECGSAAPSATDQHR